MFNLLKLKYLIAKLERGHLSNVIVHWPIMFIEIFQKNSFLITKILFCDTEKTYTYQGYCCNIRQLQPSTKYILPVVYVL